MPLSISPSLQSNSYTTYRHRPEPLSCKIIADSSLHLCNAGEQFLRIYYQPETDPPAGAAPAGILYKRNPQAAAWRQKPKSSQSPVLPWAQRAYETCLSAGSTANRRIGALTRSRTELLRLPSERITENALRALEIGRRGETCTPKAA